MINSNRGHSTAEIDESYTVLTVILAKDCLCSDCRKKILLCNSNSEVIEDFVYRICRLPASDKYFEVSLETRAEPSDCIVFDKVDLVVNRE